MSAVDAFLRAVLDHPDDDSPRLVYADWLEERGDPRGEFIRLQVDIARHGPRHPEYENWMRRATDLFRAHARNWARPLVGWVRRCRFHRGFVETAFVEWESYAECAAAVRNLAPVREVFVDLPAKPVPDLTLLTVPPALIRSLDFVPLGVRLRDEVLVIATRPPVTSRLRIRLGNALSRRVEVLPADTRQLYTAHRFLIRHLEDQGTPLALAETVEVGS